MEGQPLIPAEQALVPFYGGQILSARLPDDFIAASLDSFCNMLKINTQAQLRRILRDEVLARHLLLVIIQISDGPQVTQMLSARAIPMWLTGLQPNMVAPEKRPLIRALKEEAVEVLYRHFFKINTEPAPPPQPERPGTTPYGSARQMMHAAIDALYAEQDERFAALEDRQVQVEAWRESADQRLMVFEEVQEAMGEHLVETRERLARLEGHAQRGPAPSAARTAAGHAPSSGPPLSPQHQVQLTELARALRAQTGMPITKMREALAGLFGVEDVSDIPDAGWDVVNEWFWQRRREG